MRTLTAWLARLSGTFRKRRTERDLDAETQSHLAMHIVDNLRAGMTAEEARRQALMKLGGLEQTKELVRDRRALPWLETLLQDLRFGARMLRKNPGFASVAVLTMALGIGANTTIFSVVNAVLLKPLAMQQPSRVVYLQEEWQNLASSVSVGNFADVRRQSASLGALNASAVASFNLSAQQLPERVQGELVTADYFITFGVPPLLGRVFTADEDKPGHAHVTVISERLWRTRLHADAGVLGRPLRVNGLLYTVLGVMPRTFDPLLSRSDVWIPAAFTAQQLADHDNHYLNVMGRLKQGVALADAQSELNIIALREQKEFPIDNADRGFRIAPLTTVLLGDEQLALRMMLAAVAFVLLIACANVANLQLARSRIRHKEIAVRAALGASPRRIVRQLLAENLVLGVISGAAGILLAFWGVSMIVAKGPAQVPRLDESRLDATTLVFACAVTLLASFLFGLAPALRSASTRLSEAFKESVGSSHGSRDRIRSVLVVGEVALALLLMTGAGLLIRSALLVSRVDPGFDTSNLAVGRIGLPDAAYHEPAAARQAFEQMTAAAAALPGVQSAAVVSRAPLAGGGGSNGIIPEGKALDPANILNSQLQIVSPTYLSTARIPLKAGRDFTPQDTRDKALVTIVNETLARTLWPSENPIGKRFACCEFGPKGREDPVWHQVVGVVADVRAWGLDRQVQPQFYLPIAQIPPSAWDWIGRTMDLVVRTQDRSVPVRELQTIVASIARDVPIYRLSTMQQKLAGTLERSRFDTFLLALFAATALLLSSVGIYGVLSYTVAQRTREIGIRVALGATREHVLRDVLGHGLRLTAIGLAIGLIAAISGTRLLSALLYGVRSTDPVTFAAVSAVLLVVALFASYLPARRAMRVDPLVALRYE
jgi:putative ABC transport system permease protein